MGLYPFGKSVQLCGSHPAVAWPEESSAPASAAPSNSRGQKGRCPPGPAAHAAMLGKHSRRFGGGMPKGLEWGGGCRGLGRGGR